MYLDVPIGKQVLHQLPISPVHAGVMDGKAVGKHSFQVVVQHLLRLVAQHLPNINQFLPTIPTFSVRETDVSRHNGDTSGAPLKPLRVDSALRALSTLRGFREAPAFPPLCRETQSLG